MGIYVNPGNVAFTRVLNSDIYIDKTNLISVVNRKINTMDCFLCISRPRRFGKSIAANMLSAYYSRGCDSGGLFAGLKITGDDTFPVHLNQHNVIRLDIQQFLKSRHDLDTFIGEIGKNVVRELKESFPESRGLSASAGLETVLNEIFQQTQKGFIFIIDEWDCVFRVAKERQDIQKDYLDFLRSLFKEKEYVELAYMTGILPIKKYGEHSALNIFDEYSIINAKQLDEYFGFTEDEVREQCRKHGMDYAEMESWYDGYLLDGRHIYNPKSVRDALRWKDFQSYWTGTETYEALKVYIDMNFDGLKEAVIAMLGNAHYKVDPATSQNDMTTFKTKDDVLALLIHLGYLTYDKGRGEAFIPNREIVQEFLRSIKTGGWDGLAQALARSEELLRSTWALDASAVAEGLAAIHSETASILKYNDENSLTCTILMAYYSARAYYMNPILEMPSGKGYSDVVYLPRQNVDRPAL